MTAQTKSRLLLTILILAGLMPFVYFFYAGYLWLGGSVILAGLLFLAWVWKPWAQSSG